MAILKIHLSSRGTGLLTATPRWPIDSEAYLKIRVYDTNKIKPHSHCNSERRTVALLQKEQVLKNLRRKIKMINGEKCFLIPVRYKDKTLPFALPVRELGLKLPSFRIYITRLTSPNPFLNVQLRDNAAIYEKTANIEFINQYCETPSYYYYLNITPKVIAKALR